MMRYLLILAFLFSCASKKEEVDLSRRKAEIYYNQGTQDLVSKRYTDALKNLLEANKLVKNDSRYLNNLGMAYFFKKRPQIAIKYVKKSIEIDPKNTQAKLNLASLYMDQNQYDLAKKNFEVVLEDLTFQQQFRTYYNLGVLSLKQRNIRQALNFFKQSIAENENYCPAHFQMGKIYYTKAKFEEALNHFKGASKGTCFENPEPIYFTALTYIKLDQVVFAKEKLEDIIGRFHSSPYAKTAQQQLNNLNRKLNRYEAKVLSGENPYGQILTPDF